MYSINAIHSYKMLLVGAMAIERWRELQPVFFCFFFFVYWKKVTEPLVVKAVAIAGYKQASMVGQLATKDS